MTAPLPMIGQYVRFVTKTAHTGTLQCTLQSIERTGIVTLVWSNGEVVVDTDAGSFIPEFGDTWEPL